MRVGIADTMFARVDMASVAINEIKKEKNIEIERYTVPGFKDLPVAAKKLIEEHGCDLVMAFGWAGKEAIDEVCAHEANQGLINVELMTNTHVIKVFFHESETKDLKKQVEIAKDRARKHARNAILLLKGKEALTPFAAKGQRQGYEHAGSLE